MPCSCYDDDGAVELSISDCLDKVQNCRGEEENGEDEGSRNIGTEVPSVGRIVDWQAFGHFRCLWRMRLWDENLLFGCLVARQGWRSLCDPGFGGREIEEMVGNDCI